jgi:N-formylglutamate deformylase
MKPSEHPAKPPLFTYYAPLNNEFRGLVSIPHSGEVIPEEFKPYLSNDLKALGQDVDTKVNELIHIDQLQKAGIGVLVAHIHRVCVDLNRTPEQSVLFWKENTHGVQLVTKPVPRDLELQWIQDFHQPYFAILTALIHELEHATHPKLAPVIDLHSMPSAPTDYHFKLNPNQKMTRADFCLSDQRGKSCEPEFIQYFHESLKKAGYSAAINDPYIGGYVTIYVDQFKTNNIQIEINRQLYLDEVHRQIKTELVPSLKDKLTKSLESGLLQFSRT